MTTQITTLLLDVVPEPRGTMATVMANGQQLGWYTALYEQHQQEEMTLPEYLERCREHPEMYASPHERLLNAIGEPVVLDTSAD